MVPRRNHQLKPPVGPECDHLVSCRQPATVDHSVSGQPLLVRSDGEPTGSMSRLLYRPVPWTCHAYDGKASFDPEKYAFCWKKFREQQVAHRDKQEKLHPPRLETQSDRAAEIKTCQQNQTVR